MNGWSSFIQGSSSSPLPSKPKLHHHSTFAGKDFQKSIVSKDPQMSENTFLLRNGLNSCFSPDTKFTSHKHSLQLLLNDPLWETRVSKVLHRFREHMKTLASIPRTEDGGLYTLNDELICVELCGDEETPSSVWENVNATLSSISTLTSKDKKIVTMWTKKKNGRMGAGGTPAWKISLSSC